MAKKKENAELMKKHEAHPVSHTEKMENYFERFFRHPFSMMSHPMWSRPPFAKLEDISPTVDIFEQDGNVVVKADIPGISKDDLNISISEGVLTLSGERKKEEKVEKENYHRVERSYGSFSRSFRLPGNVNDDKATASFKEGVLEVKVPMTKESIKKKILID